MRKKNDPRLGQLVKVRRKDTENNAALVAEIDLLTKEPELTFHHRESLAK